jgi:3-(3-hydroxy-phenyl)propionate hydroxylase/flavoprotein hydroxylase
MRDTKKAQERDARMIAARKANEQPDKLRYPALSGGLIANHGDLFPQGLISTAERTALFDDIAGTSWLIVTNGREALSAMSRDDRDAFAAIGGREIAFGFASMFGGSEISDTGGVYARWFSKSGCVAAIVRPDSYVYGLARDPGELAALTKELLSTLRRP